MHVQVQLKSQALIALLQQGPASHKAHAALSLASRMLGQCEAQVLQQPQCLPDHMLYPVRVAVGRPNGACRCGMTACSGDCRVRTASCSSGRLLEPIPLTCMLPAVQAQPCMSPILGLR